MKSKRSWLRVSLRAFLILVTCIAIVIASFAHYANKRKSAFLAIREAGGEIRMKFGEPSILEKWFGAELFGHIHKVNLRKGSVDNDLLIHIGALSKLGRLDLTDAAIDDEGIVHIQHLPLTELWLQGSNITDASASVLSQVKSLEFLQLNSTSVSDKFLEQLETLPKLQDMGLRGTKVTGAGMQHLSRHPQLTKLDVYSTEVSDSGVADLIDCKSLTELGLSSTKVTDAVFEHLDKLPNLTDVDLSANRPVTTEAVLAFEKSHPKCDIDWYGR